jgi:thiamine-phosphate pyrophosphorylase
VIGPRLPPLNAILDEAAARASGWTVPALAQACLDGGATFLQVRAKGLGGRAYLEVCDAVVALARPRGATVIVNDRADLARLCRASGVHVGQRDLSPAAVRAVIGRSALVGLSTHTMAQVRTALRQPVDYVAVGPVFETRSKDTGDGAVGLDFVTEAAGLARGAAAGGPGRPVVAIGGITLERARAVVAAGAASVAVISDLLATGDPASRVREYLDVLSEGGGLR